MKGQEHDRMRDRDVIEAAFLLKKIAAQYGASIEALASQVIAREMQFNRDATNMGIPGDLRGPMATRKIPCP